MWGPVITAEEASFVFEESPSLELLTPDPHCKFLFQVYDELKLLAKKSKKLKYFVAKEQFLLDHKNRLPKVKPSKVKVKPSKVEVKPSKASKSRPSKRSKKERQKESPPPINSITITTAGQPPQLNIFLFC